MDNAKKFEEYIKKIIEDAALADKEKQAKRAAAIKEKGDKIEYAASTAGNYNEEGFELQDLNPKGGRKTKRRRQTKTRRTKTRRTKKNKLSRTLL
jgi:hypothetical protein